MFISIPLLYATLQAEIGENRGVAQYGTLTWGIEATISAANANGNVKCKITPPGADCESNVLFVTLCNCQVWYQIILI